MVKLNYLEWEGDVYDIYGCKCGKSNVFYSFVLIWLVNNIIFLFWLVEECCISVLD